MFLKDIGIERQAFSGMKKAYEKGGDEIFEGCFADFILTSC